MSDTVRVKKSDFDKLLAWLDGEISKMRARPKPQPKPQPKLKVQPRQPMTTEQAARTLDNAIRTLANDRNLSYPQAFEALANEKPGLFAGYRAVIDRSNKQK